MTIIEPENHGETLAKAAVIGLRIFTPAVGVGLALAVGIEAVPVYGTALGVLAAVVAAGSGILAILLLSPRVQRRKLGQSVPRRSAEELSLLSMMLEASIDLIRSSDVRAGLRHTAETLNGISERATADVDIQHFSLLNMQSLVSIADAFVQAEQADRGPVWVPRVLETLRDIDKAAMQKDDVALSAAVVPLQVELAVSNRLIEEERIAS